MSKSSSGAKGGRSAKSSSAGSIKEAAMVQKKAIQTSEDHIITLRKALFTEQGIDKDVTTSFKPFLSYKRNGLDLNIEFAAKLNSKERKWAYELSQDNMKGVDSDMTDAERMDELKYKANRFLVIRESASNDDDCGKPIGYAMFRFTMQGELLDEMCGLPSLYVYDIQILPKFQRKGLGLHLMNLMQLIGRKESMSFVSIIVPDECMAMNEFLENKLPSFEEDCFDYAQSEEIEMEAITVFHRCLDPSIAGGKTNKQTTQAAVLGPVVTDTNRKVVESPSPTLAR